MKKLIFSVVILFAVLASVNSQVRGIAIPSDPRFSSVYEQVLKLNEGRFTNLNKIQVGDTVLFPSLSGVGTEFLIANEPVSGIHDCLYRMTGKYLAGQLKTEPVKFIANAKPVVPTEKPSFWSSDLFIWGLIAFLIVITILFVIVFYRYIKPVNINSNPVVRDGLSKNSAEAAAQISALSGSPVIKSERGRLICSQSVMVDMNFSNGLKKVELISGEEYYRVTQADGVVRYARCACGNLINGSIAQLPEGVTFVPSTEENATWSTEDKTQENQTTDEETKPLEVELHIIDHSVMNGDDVATILEAAGKMVNVPSSITCGNLVIRFYKEKEKAEDK